MKKRILSWGLILSLLFTLLPVSALATGETLPEDGQPAEEPVQCTCGAEPDAEGIVTHAEGCPFAVQEEPAAGTEDPPAEAEDPPAETEDPPAQPEEPPVETEQPPAETEQSPVETENPVLEALTPPVLTCEPLDEENSSNMVLAVEGNWDSYAWERCSYGFWSDWSGDGPSLILSKENFTAYGFRCTVTRGEQSVTSETFAYDPTVLEQPAMMANGLSDDLLYGSSDYMKFGKRLPNSTFFNIKGLDDGYEIQTTYADAGYRTAISVNGGTKMSVFYRGEPISVGNSLTAETRLEIVYGGRYVKVTYEVSNHGSAIQNFRIGSSADVMIDNNDRAKVVGVRSSTGNYTGLSMNGSPKNNYQFSLIAPDCDTLWYGYYSKAYINIFHDLSDKDTPYSKGSGMAWSWSGSVAPGQTWSRYVLIGAGALPPAPDAPTLSVDSPTSWTTGTTVTLTGMAAGSDTAHVNFGGQEYRAAVNADGTFSIPVSVPENSPVGPNSFTYWSTTNEGGISEIKTQAVNIIAGPSIHLTTDRVTVMEDETGFGETWLRNFIQSSYGTVTVSPSGIDTSTPGTTTVTYTAGIDGFENKAAALTVTVLPKPAELTQTHASGSAPFALTATMKYTGGLTYTETGFVYGALQNPTMTLHDGKVVTSPAVSTKGGALSASVDGSKLAYGVTYYARAYAIASDGTIIYGGQSQGFGMGTPHYGTFSVTNNGDHTFTITRTGGTDGQQTVYYRTVNGSAIGGTHFTHQAGSVTFQAGEASKSIPVTEKSVTSIYAGNAATAYSNAERTYSLEIYRVAGGAGIGTGTAERTMSKDFSYEVDAKLFNEYQTSTPSGETDRGDYDGTGRGWKENTEGANAKEIVAIGNILPSSSYMTAVAQNIQYKLSFQAKEVDNGYQHIQISPGEGIDLSHYPYEGAWKGTMDSAVYAAIFEHGGSSKNTSYKTYTFPNVSGSVPNLNKETWLNQTYNGDGYIKLPVRAEKLTVGFAGSGSGNDAWKTNAVTHYLKYLDNKEPQLLGVAPMAGGSYLPGDSVTVALVFDEIVDSTRSPSISSVQVVTNWGTFHYSGGVNTNVLYFTGTVSQDATGSLVVQSITNASYIKDMADDVGTDTSGTVSGGNTGAGLGNGGNAPTVTVSDITNTNGTLTGTVSTSSVGVKLEYVWSASSSVPTTGWQIVANDSAVSTRQTAGTWYLHARATNGDGVTTYASNSYTFGSDPVQPPSLTVDADNTNWAKERVITITRSPANAQVTVKTPDGTTVPVSGGTYKATANGAYTFTLTSNDETITQMVSVSRLDATAPTVEIVDLTNTIHTEAVTLTVRVSDGGSGLQSVTGTWSNGSTTVAAAISGENGVYTTTSPDESGTWTLTVTATDTVGNTGEDTSSAYTIHADRPTLVVTKQSESATGAVYRYTVTANGNTGITVALPDGSSTDQLSGSFTLTEPGDYLIAVTDAAGHFVSETITVTAPEGGTLDGVAPDVRLSIESEAWTNQAVTVTVSVYDAGSQGKSLTASRDGQMIQLTESADEPGSFTGSFSVFANDTYTVTCADAAGNTGSGEISIPNIDTTAPGIAVSGNPTDWTAGDVTITLTVTDEQSGVSRVEAQTDGSTVPVSGNGSTYTFTVSENGVYTVTATDKAGNSARETVTISKIDNGTPVLTITGGMQSAASLDLMVSANTHGGSGVTVTVTKDGQDAGTVQNGSYTVTSAGTYTFTATTGAGLTADRTVTVHSIAFLHDSASYETHLVVSGGTVTEPAQPTKDGYTFDGWYSGQTPWDFTNGKATQDLTLTAHWTLAAPTVALSADQTEATYQGGQTVITLTALPSSHGAAVDYTYEWYKDHQKLDGKAAETLELSTVAGSGTYTVEVTASAGGQSTVVTSQAVTVTIHRAVPVVSAWPTASGITYGETLGKSALTGGSGEIQGTFTWQDGSITPSSGARSCTAVFTPHDTGNYTPVEGAVIVQVSKATLTPAVTSVADKVYDGNTSATGTIALSGAALHEQPTASGAFAFVDAGAGAGKAVHVTVTLDGGWGDNYVLSAAELTATASITPKTVGLVWHGYEDLFYTGQPVNVTAAAAGLVAGDACTVIVAGGNETEVGTYTAVATDLSNPNYQLPATGTTWEYTIARAAGSASVTMEDWTYGETAAAPVPTSATHGTGSVTYRYTGTTAGGTDYDSSAIPTEAGRYTVTATFAATDHYGAVTAAATFTVVRNPLFATWSGLSQVYGDNGSVKVLLSGIVGGDNIKANLSGAGTDAGTYGLTAQLTGDAAHNYTLQNSEAVLTVRPKALIFTVTDNIKQETGSGLTAQISASDPNCAYTIAYQKNGTDVAAPTDAGSYEIWVELTDPNYRHTDGSPKMQVGTLTITQAPPVMYTATFAGGENAGGTAPAAQSAVKDGQITLPANSFTRGSYRFTGWTADGDTRLYQPGDRFTMPARNVTFTAQWQAVFTVGGTVTEKTDGGDTKAENAVVSLWLGANKISEVTTGNDGTFGFENLVPGIYNLVVTKDVRTVTSKVEPTENKTCDAVLPKGATNSVVEVAPGSPNVVVGDLNTVFDHPDDAVYTAEDQETVRRGGKVEITFTAEEKQKTEVSADLQKIQAVSGGRDLALVMDYKLDKAIFHPDGTLAASQPIPQSNVLLEVLLPLPTELQGKNSYSVYRVHGSTAQELTMTPSADLGEYFTVSRDKTSLTLYVKCFSTYAIGYAESSGNHGGGSSGGGTFTPVYPPSIEEPEHGSVTISPKKTGKGEQVTITPTPDDGYAVDTVIVADSNGKEVAVTPNGDGTYTFVQPSGKVTITVTFRQLASVSGCPRDDSCPMAPFTDADRNAWYHDGIHSCVEHGLMRGTSQTTFAPNIPITRGMIVTILWRLESSPIVDSPLDYDDVKPEDWCGEAVRWADSAGVATGYGNGKFGPNAPITREQMAAMLWRYAGSPKADGSLASFTDRAQTSSWAQPAMIWAVEQGLIAGVSSDRLEPKGQATRAQAATILTRFAQNIAQ